MSHGKDFPFNADQAEAMRDAHAAKLADQPAPDFEEALTSHDFDAIYAGLRELGWREDLARARVSIVRERISALLNEREAREAAARRVEYAWENLRGWMPNGRGVKNWTREMNDAVAALPATESAQSADAEFVAWAEKEVKRINDATESAQAEEEG